MKFQVFETFPVEFCSCALNAFAIIFKAKPCEVFADAVDVGWTSPALVVILDAQVNF